MVATGLCILGVAFWTLPGGIIGSGFALKVEQENKQKQFNRLLPSAASLIQSWWRMKVLYKLPTRNSSRLVSVLKTFISKPTQSHTQNFKEDNNKKVEKKKIEQHLPATVLLRGLDRNDDLNENEVDTLIERELKHEREVKDREFVFLKVKPDQLILIRILLMIKYFVAKKKFKLAHKPYDFKDVIDQYTQGNLDIIVKIKELHRKLDQINANNRVLAPYLKIPEAVSPISLKDSNGGIVNMRLSDPLNKDPFFFESRTVVFEQRFEALEKKLDKISSLLADQHQ
jgi:potassium voltage-gated channel KQT-like subfamily protein 5